MSLSSNLYSSSSFSRCKVTTIAVTLFKIWPHISKRAISFDINQRFVREHMSFVFAHSYVFCYETPKPAIRPLPATMPPAMCPCRHSRPAVRFRTAAGILPATLPWRSPLLHRQRRQPACTATQLNGSVRKWLCGFGGAIEAVASAGNAMVAVPACLVV